MIPKGFSTSLRYQGQGEPDSLLADVEALRQYGESAQGNRWALVALPLGWVVFGFATAFQMGGGGWYVAALFWSIAGFFVYSYLDGRLARHVLEERRLKTAKALLRALACDVSPGEPLTLALQFGEYHQAHFRTDGNKSYRINSAAYLQPWLAVSGRLADGTRFEAAVDLHAKRKERSKTKGRKKVKEDLCEHVRVTLRPDELPAGAESGWPTRVRRARLLGTAHVHKALVRKGRVTLEVRTRRAVRVTDKGSVVSGKDAEQQLAGPQHVLKALLAAYGALAARGA